MDTDRIPLFPLEIVLFPDRALPLHILESRYRLMTRRCADTRSPFGVVLSSSGGMAHTGCTAMIVKILKQYDDGRSDILTMGRKVFRLLQTYEEQTYAEAAVVYLEDDSAGIDAGISARLAQLFDQCHRILYSRPAPSFETEGSGSLSYYVASELPVDLAFRQTLLELRSEAERQRRLTERLTQWIPQLERRNRVQEKAGGNGHGNL
jgi:Lon protease-like protein